MLHGGGADDELVRHFICQPVAQVDLPDEEPANRHQDFLGSFLLHDVTASARA
jgi:hypothetical protein